LCLRAVLQTTVTMGENADLEEINNAWTNSTLLRALTSLIGGCVETNAHRCIVVWCLSVFGHGRFRTSFNKGNCFNCPGQRVCLIVRSSLSMFLGYTRGSTIVTLPKFP
jgi:hypothetical protein